MRIRAIRIFYTAAARFQRDTQGAFILLAALTLSVMLGLVGLGIDSGRAMLERERMQNAADLAALAATYSYYEKINARETPIVAYNAALATARRYYAANAATGVASSRNVTFGLVPSSRPGGQPGFAATIRGDVNTTFTRVLN